MIMRLEMHQIRLFRLKDGSQGIQKQSHVANQSLTPSNPIFPRS